MSPAAVQSMAAPPQPLHPAAFVQPFWELKGSRQASNNNSAVVHIVRKAVSVGGQQPHPHAEFHSYTREPITALRAHADEQHRMCAVTLRHDGE